MQLLAGGHKRVHTNASRPRHHAACIRRAVCQHTSLKKSPPACQAAAQGGPQATSTSTAATAAATVPAARAAAEVASADNGELVQRLLTTPLQQLMREAAAVRDEGHPRIITFSPKVRTCTLLKSITYLNGSDNHLERQLSGGCL